ncbi:MAG: DUF4350 domain-containing protein [Bacteroidota bacterium]
MKRSSIYYLIMGLIVILYLVISISLSEKKIDWSYSFSGKDKIPFGSFVLKEELDILFPEAEILQTEVRVYNTLAYDTVVPYYEKHCAYLLINSELSLDHTDIQELLYFVSLGNDAFLVGDAIPSELLDTLRLTINPANILAYSSMIPGDSLSREDTLNAKFLNPNLAQQKGYYFNAWELGRSLKLYEETETDLIPVAVSVNNLDSVNMVRVDVGEGNIFICTSPLAFTNYYMLSGPNLGFVQTALSHLSEDTEVIVWDEYYKAKNLARISAQDNSLRYILSQPGLRWAFWITILMGLLFALFEVKRKQRMVPIISPLPNSTLDFTETIGRLYYQNSTHKELCDKKIKLWLSYVYHKYGLEVSELEDNFTVKLSGKTGIPLMTIKNLVFLIKRIGRQTSISENEFTELNNSLNTFYQEVQV